MKNELKIIINRPFIPVLFSFIIGILLADSFPDHIKLAWLLIILCSAFIVAFIFAESESFRKIIPPGLIQKKRIILAPIILFVSLGYVSATDVIYPGKDAVTKLSENPEAGKRLIRGHVASLPKILDGSSSFIVDVSSISDSDSEDKISSRIMAYCEGMIDPPEPGTEISFLSTLKPFKSFNNPGCFDYKRHMLFEGIKARCYVKANDVIFSEKKKDGLSIFADRLRLKAGKSISNAVPNEAAILKAIIIGDQSEISPELRESFNRTGSGHLIAISGLHIGIIAAFSFFSARFLLSFCPMILRKGILLRASSIAALPPVLFYGLISGFEPSAQRAVIMASVFLFAGIFSRENDLPNTLAASAFIILAIMPSSLFSISFRLSYMAVIFILLSMPLLKKIDLMIDDNGTLGKIYAWVLKALSVSFFACIGTAPFVMHYFGFISPIGFPANLILIPILGMASVAPGIFAVASLPFSEKLFLFFIKTAAMPVKAGTEIIFFLSGLPFSGYQTISPDEFEIVIVYMFMISGIILMNAWLSGDEKKPEKTHVIIIKTFLLFSFILIAFDTAYSIKKRFFNDGLEISFIDVGHGNSALIEFPKGRTMLIDGGGFHGKGRLDTGKDIIAPFLRRKKILSLDYMILTHPDEDHMKGLLYAAERFKPKEFFEGRSTGRSELYSEIISVLKKNGASISALSSSSNDIEIQGSKIEVLNPDENIETIENKDSDNDSSLVLRLLFKDKSVLFTGDISSVAEKRIVAMYPERLKSDIVLIPHHGSNGSGSEIFLDNANPEIAIISTGRKNFPGRHLLERLFERGIRVFRTDMNGCVSAAIDEKGYRIKVFRDVVE